MEFSSNSFKIRKSFNMSPIPSSLSKTICCPFYGKYGFCNKIHNLMHQDCKNFFKYQYCFQNLVNKCPYFHRVICENWKKQGKCPIPDCENLHKNCENYQNYRFCKRNDCPFFHCGKTDKNKKSPQVFIRKSTSIKVIEKTNKTKNQPKSENEFKFQEEENFDLPKPPKKLMNFTQKSSFVEQNYPNDYNNRNIERIQEKNEQVEEISLNDLDEEEEKTSENKESVDNEGEEEKKSSIEKNDIHNPLHSIQNSPGLTNRPSNILNNIRNRRNILGSSIERPNFRMIENPRVISEEPFSRSIERTQGNLTIFSLNRTNVSNPVPGGHIEGSIGHTLERINQFSNQLRNIRESLENQEGDLHFLNTRFQSLVQIQDRLNFVRRQERTIGTLDSLIETFLLINTISNNPEMAGIKLAEFEQIPIFIFGIDDDINNKKEESCYQESSTREMCAICLEDYKKNDLVRRLYCSHQYHEDCLREWTNKKINCPVCKKNIKEDIQGHL